VLKRIFDVLVAVHEKYPALEYAQGVNFIVGSIAIHCDETVTFWLLSRLLYNHDMAYYYNNADELI
jgi:hypothetical protein